jgi:MFS family permease
LTPLSSVSLNRGDVGAVHPSPFCGAPHFPHISLTRLPDAPTIFGSLGIGGTTISLLASGVVGISMFLATIPAVLFIDKVGRRPLLVAGGVGMAICLAIVAALTGSFQDDWPSHTGAGWAGAAFIWLYIACFGFSWGPVSWVVIAELMPLSARGPGTALGASTNWMINFCVSLFVPPMMEAITYGTYIFFIAFMLMGVAYAIWLLPETRNVSLEAMDRVFKSSDATHDAAMMARITARLHAEFNGDAASSSSSPSHEEKEKDIRSESFKAADV